MMMLVAKRKEKKTISTSARVAERNPSFHGDLRQTEKLCPAQDRARRKSFKSTRKKEELAENSLCDPRSCSCIGGRFAINQMPLNDSPRILLGRDENKTDIPSADVTNNLKSFSIISHSKPVLVRETRASRLRAASRISSGPSGSPIFRPYRDDERNVTGKPPAFGFVVETSLNKRNLDRGCGKKCLSNSPETSERPIDDTKTPAGKTSNPRRDSDGQNVKGEGGRSIVIHEKRLSSEECPLKVFNLRKKNYNNSDKRRLKATVKEEEIVAKRLENNKKFNLGLLKKNGKQRIGGFEKRGTNTCRNLLIDDSVYKHPFRVKMMPLSGEVDRSRKFQGSYGGVTFSSRIGKGGAGTEGVESGTVPFPEDIIGQSSSCDTHGHETILDSASSTTNKSEFAGAERNVKCAEATSLMKVNFEAGKPSILKKGATDGTTPTTVVRVKPSQPVSILKRKSLSQDETQSGSSPVKFSPSVLKAPGNHRKRQGILKKRRSLDENEVLRKRSYSPDSGFSDFKSILKSERRCSMEELSRRTHSPECSTPQGILKRKSSREDEYEDNSGCSFSSTEPQGILKRKSFSHSNSVLPPAHIISSIAPDGGETQNNESVRPILKKKTSSEEQSTSDLSLAEVPKSILKKKTSLEADEADEKPKKPILKTGKVSADVPINKQRSSNPVFSRSHSAPVRPILKKENCRSTPFAYFFHPNASLRGVRSEGDDMLHSFSNLDGQFSSLKSRSSIALNFRERHLGSTEAYFLHEIPSPVAEVDPSVRGHFLPLEKQRRSTSLIAIPCSSKTHPWEMWQPLPFHSKRLQNLGMESPLIDRTMSIRAYDLIDPAITFSSQEVTPVGQRKFIDNEGLTGDEAPSLYGSSSARANTPRENKKGKSSEVRGRSLSLTLSSSTSFDCLDKTPFANPSFRSSSSSDPDGLFGDSMEKFRREHETYLHSSVGDRIRKIWGFGLTAPVGDRRANMNGRHHQDLFLLRKSKSVSAKTCFFNQMDAKPRAASEAEKFKEEPMGSHVSTKSTRQGAMADAIPRVTSSGDLEFHVRRLDYSEESDQPDQEEAFGKREILKIQNTEKRETAIERRVDVQFSDEAHTKKGSRGIEFNEKTPDECMKTGMRNNLNRPRPFGDDKRLNDEDGGTACGRIALSLNLAAILRKVEPVGSGTMSVREHDAGRTPKTRGSPKCLQDPGIARIINGSRNNSSIVKSQSHSSVSSVFCRPSENTTEHLVDRSGKNYELGDESKEVDDADDGRDYVGGASRRSTSQPYAPSAGPADDDMSGASIGERLAKLKRNGELNWQKRRSNIFDVENELTAITGGNYKFKENLSLRREISSFDGSEKGGKTVEGSVLAARSSVLADRLEKLDAAKDGWKKRIQPSDAVRFSVEGKLLEKMESSKMATSPTETCSTRSEGEKRSPKPVKFRSKKQSGSAGKPERSAAFGSTSNGPVDGLPGSVGDRALPGTRQGDVSVVTVPKIDDETFASFFRGMGAGRTVFERLDIAEYDLDEVIKINSSQLLVQRKNIKAQRRRATVRNPLKSLNERLEKQEYTESRPAKEEKQNRRIRTDKGMKESNFAAEALGGLASREDFTAVNLKKPSEGSIISGDAPYKELMLMQVKGRRHVQTRLIEPIARNVNPGDCFILVTPTKIFHYVGELANIIEKSRSAEISVHIQQKGDLGCTANSVVTISENGRATEEEVEQFWKLLGGKPECERRVAGITEDETFESAIVSTNMVYEVVGDELVPNEVFWGSIPKIEILDPNKILVFDFGSEFYVWNGKNVELSRRKFALKLAKELWSEGYNYSGCDVCPLTAASYAGTFMGPGKIPDSAKFGTVRPPWTLFAKITQNMETVLFREKFLDWPDYFRAPKEKKKDEGVGESDGSGLKECDARAMLENALPECGLILEGSNLGRGNTYFDEETRRCLEITTQGVTVCHVNGYEYSELSPRSVGQFHMKDSYVVRWHYTVTVTGRELSGQPSKHITTGRDRYAYFCWQGQDSPINDKGAAACITVELDKERGPQLQVMQGCEPPAFLNLFRGRMVVHDGKRLSRDPPDEWRLFVCRGEVESEAALIQVSCNMKHLRSKASLLLVNGKMGKLIMWHGSKSLDQTKRVIASAASHIQIQKPDEFGFETENVTSREEFEGEESSEFLAAVGGDDRTSYHSLLHEHSYVVRTPRLFHLTSVSGQFHFTEIASPHLHGKDVVTPFPFLQTDLYSASQPALFLLDTSSGLYLWQGWPQPNCFADGGPGYIRFQVERQLAMSTAVSYWNSKHGNTSPKAYLVWAGLEPPCFTNQFPFWTDHPDVREINLRIAKHPGNLVPLEPELNLLSHSFYSPARLQDRPLPQGVDPTSIEEHLKPQSFQQLFGVEREEFLKLPSWKKKKLKQEAGLF